MDPAVPLLGDILDADEIKRLFAMLIFVGAAETNMRTVGLTLLGLRTKIEGLQNNPDLSATLRLISATADRYSVAQESILESIRQRRELPSEPPQLLH